MGDRLPEVRVLGPLEVVAAGHEIALSAPKLRRLLAALVTSSGKPRSVDALLEAIWDATPPTSADKLVQVYVSQLRKALPPGLTISTEATGYAIRTDGWQLDARRFEHLLAEARAERAASPRLAAADLRRALGMWRGAAYGEFANTDFARPEAERLAELRRQALEERIELDLELGRHTEVLAEIRAAADADPLRERLQGHFMRALYLSGQQVAALEHYQAVRARLIEDLGVEPGDDLRRLQQQMLRHDVALEATQSVAATEPAADLPAPPNPLRGRDPELAELQALLADPEVRLVVLTGAGGSGKTRLAIEAGRRAAAAFTDGLRYISLAAIREADALAAAIVAALDVSPATGPVSDALTMHLRNRETLLILDNFEQLRGAAPLLVTLLAGAPRLTILVTSRVVLHVSGEHVFPVDPLPDDAAATVFTDRAARANAKLARERFDRGTIEMLCRRLDRLPLAIELAAGQLRALTSDELLARLDTRLPMLVGGPSDLPTRQQTMRSTLAWSFDQLEPQAQGDLAALSVFADGCTLDAAAEVLGSAAETPRRLLELVDHSLLTHSPTSHGSRYAMLETVREFAAERLEAGGNQAQVRYRHAEYMLRFAQSLGLSIDALAAGRPKRHELAVVEQANLRAALDWAHDSDPALGLELMAALEQFWISSNPPEAARRLEALLERACAPAPDVRARALRDLGGVTEFVGDQPKAVRCYNASIELYRQLGDEGNELQLVHRLVQQAMYAGDRSEARTLVDEGLPRAAAGGYRFAECQLRLTSGWLELEAGDHDSAYREVAAARQLMREIGEWPWGETGAVRTLGEISSAAGRHVQAIAFGREALSLIAPLGDRIKTVTVLTTLALSYLRAGDPATAGLLWGGVEREEQRSFLGFWKMRCAPYANELNSCTDEAFDRARQVGRRQALVDLIAEQLDQAK